MWTHAWGGLTLELPRPGNSRGWYVPAVPICPCTCTHQSTHLLPGTYTTSILSQIGCMVDMPPQRAEVQPDLPGHIMLETHMQQAESLHHLI